MNAADRSSPGSQADALAAAERARLRGLAIAMAGVAAGFWVGLVIGFHCHGDPAPGVLEAGFVPALVLLTATLAAGARVLWRWRADGHARARRWRVVRRRRGAPSQARDHVADRAAWLDALRRDPQRHAYAERIEAGDLFWTPLRIDYDLDRAATACCVHLAPIERAMRDDGIRVRLQGGQAVLADCVLDVTALADGRWLRGPVQAQEVSARERSNDDPPEARLHCSACASSVWVVQADRAAAATPRWPAATPGGPGCGPAAEPSH